MLVYFETRIIILDASRYKTADSNKYFFCVDHIAWESKSSQNRKNYIAVKGWIVPQKEAIKSAALKVVLKSKANQVYYILPTMMAVRKDVTKHFNKTRNNTLDYDNSGFSAIIPYTKKLPENDDYMVYILCKINGHEELVSLNTTLRTWGKK